MDSSPRIIVASGNKFHAYHLARGAERAGWLHRFVTTIFDRRETGIPLEKVVQIPLPAYVSMLIQRLPSPSSQAWSYLIGDNWFDRAASRYAPEADIYHAFNHHGLHGIRKAKRNGAITIIERSSAHPTMQHQLLRDEFNRYGITYPAAYARLIAKHLQEYAEADWIFVASEFVHRTMLAEGVSASKMRQVHLGFAPQYFYPGEKSDNVFRVIFVGALSLQKGLPYLLEGFRLANLPPDRSELLLVGEPFPDAHTFLPKYRGVYRRLRFVPHHDLARVYHTGSVFVLPSLQDGFGMVVYEAAACGLPVIVSENVGASVRDGEDGFIVPIRSAEAIAEKLLYLYNHETERRRMGQSAREYVGQFTWEKYQNELIGHYREIWEGHR
ncbi:MAG: glycosyltransferase family 4 protein [Chloroflexi bacterium]|nr:glycosyltransferase family 4 protein [Chloroflexota bacterium]